MPILDAIVPANVLASTGARTRYGVAGAEITQGEPLFRFVADPEHADYGKLFKASCDEVGVAPDASRVEGIALNHAYPGQPVDYVVSDPLLNIGQAVDEGTAIWLGPGAGELDSVTNLEGIDTYGIVTPMFPVFLGFGVLDADDEPRIAFQIARCPNPIVDI